jgi:hypothetical protein
MVGAERRFAGAFISFSPSMRSFDDLVGARED